jgi:Ca-activated chloride channel family protein
MKASWAALVAAGLLCAAVWAGGQQPAAPASGAAKADESSVIKVDVTRNNILFTVTDKKGRFVTDLTKDDFEIMENRRPQAILEFAAHSDLPLRLGILIDTSNSIRDRFRFEQEAATEFVNSVLHPHIDKAMVVGFDTTAQLASDLVDDPYKVAQAISTLRPGGGTALYDALYFACRDKLGQDQPRHDFRRAIVLLSDGDDNQSRYTRDQALEVAITNEVVIYAISTNITPVESDGDKVLKYFTAATGGVAYFPFKAEDMAQSFENIANELRHQYNISYRPEPLATDGLFHEVQMRVKGRKDLVIRARSGYYAQKM